MNVKLVSISQPRVKTKDESRYLTAEEFICYCARVSNPSNQLNIETSSKLLNYCIVKKHWSIFEQVGVTFEIVTSRAIAAQILRHKSQRYSVATNLEKLDWRLQGKTNRQVGEEEYKLDEVTNKSVNQLLEFSINLYNQLVVQGVAKECARMILPLCTETTMYMTGSLRSWIHYIDLRAKPETQKEHRLIAEEIKRNLTVEFPDVSEALKW